MMVLEEGGESVIVRKMMDHGTVTYRLEYYVAGERRRKTRADEREALTDARTVLAMR